MKNKGGILEPPLKVAVHTVFFYNVGTQRKVTFKLELVR